MVPGMDLTARRDFGWTKRQLADANSGFTQLSDGRILIEVRHQPLRSITAEMAAWWFGVYADLQLEVEGETQLAFVYWHPEDHLNISRPGNTNKPLAPGDWFTMTEAYAGDEKNHTSEKVQVLRRDTGGYGIRVFRAKMTVAQLSYDFEDSNDGLVVSTRLRIGVADGWAKTLVNHLFVPLLFDGRKTEAWMQHNVEEVGRLQCFLPDLWAQRDQGQVISLGKSGGV